MKAGSIGILLVFAIMLSACSSGKRKNSTISVSGAFALYPMMVKWTEEYKKENPKIRFNISAGGAGKGMADALSGAIDLGMVSRDIMPEEKEKGAWWVAVVMDAVIPTMNAENPLAQTIKKRGLTREEFRKIYLTGEITNWNQLPGITTDQVINVFTRSDACGAAATWAEFLGGKQEELAGVGVFGDPGLADAVIKDVKGVGFNNTVYLYDSRSGVKNQGIDIIPIDVNESGVIEPEEYFYQDLHTVLQAIGEGKYPSPPARDLYLVAGGTPRKKAALDFLRWVCTKGQAFVSEAGYVPLSAESLIESNSKLK